MRAAVTVLWERHWGRNKSKNYGVFNAISIVFIEALVLLRCVIALGKLFQQGIRLILLNFLPFPYHGGYHSVITDVSKLALTTLLAVSQHFSGAVGVAPHFAATTFLTIDFFLFSDLLTCKWINRFLI
ncbi:MULTISPECIES: hypothetical protein [Duganella]|uniref:hypothetical protein n=1 Tax=Duganella TaxID=75654 RepID=UPI00333EF685